MPIIVCIGCGCTEDAACVNLVGELCRWTATEPLDAPSKMFHGDLHGGMCSFCATTPLDELVERMARRVVAAR